MLEQQVSAQVFARPRALGLPWFVNGVRTQRARPMLATLTSQRSRTAPKAAGPTLSGSSLVRLSGWAVVNQLRAAKPRRSRVAGLPGPTPKLLESEPCLLPSLDRRAQTQGPSVLSSDTPRRIRVDAFLALVSVKERPR